MPSQAELRNMHIRSTDKETETAQTNSQSKTVARTAMHRKILLLLVSVLLCEVCATLLPSAKTAFEITEAVAQEQDPRVKCALSLTRQQLSDSTHIVLLGHARWIGSFLEAVHIPVTVLQLQDKRIPAHNLQFDVVFLVTDGDGNRSFVDKALNHIRRSHGRYSPRVVVWWQTGIVQAAVDVARDYEMMRLVVIIGYSEKLRVFGRRDECVHRSLATRAILLGGCNFKNLFPDLRHWNFGGCKLRVGVDDFLGYLEVRKSHQGDFRVSGVLADLAFTVAEHFNAVLQFELASDARGVGWKYQNGTTIGLMADVMDNRVELALTIMHRTIERIEAADFIPGYHRIRFCFIVPSGLGKPSNPWNLLLLAFRPFVWALAALAFCVVLVVLSFTWWRVREHPVQDSFFYILSMLLGNSPPFTACILTSSVRLLVALWLILSIVLTTGYQAVRNSITAAPWKIPEIQDLSELRRSKLKIVGHYFPMSFLHEFAEEFREPVLLELLARAELKWNFGKDDVQKVATEKNTAIYTNADKIDYTAALENQKKRRLLHIVPHCPMTLNFPAVFMLRRGSPWTGSVSYLVNRAYECGLTQHWVSRSRIRRPDLNQGWSPLSFIKLQASFYLLVLGLTASALVLCAEVMVDKWSRRREIEY